MIKKYNKNEFVVNGIEIREIEYCKDGYNDDTCFEYTIESLEAYFQGNQIDVEDESIISKKLWDKITELFNKRLDEEEYEIESEIDKFIENI